MAKYGNYDISKEGKKWVLKDEEGFVIWNKYKTKKEAMDDADDFSIDRDYRESGNMHCDSFGTCSGMGCPKYFDCNCMCKG